MKLMKPKEYDLSRLKFPCYASPKLDGMCGGRYDNGFWSYNEKKLKGLDHINIELKREGILDALHGELMCPGYEPEEGRGLIRNHAITPEARFFVFDLPNSPLPYADRQLKLKDMVSPLIFTKYVDNVILLTAESGNSYYQKCLSMGYEGIVYKTPYHKYKFGISWDWMRRKPVKTVDLKIVGKYEGTGKYEDMLGGVICRYRGRNIKVGSGFRDHERIAYWRDDSKIIGRTCEVAYKRATAKGSLEHPRYIRMRYSK